MYVIYIYYIATYVYNHYSIIIHKNNVNYLHMCIITKITKDDVTVNVCVILYANLEMSVYR